MNMHYHRIIALEWVLSVEPTMGAFNHANARLQQ